MTNVKAAVDCEMTDHLPSQSIKVSLHPGIRLVESGSEIALVSEYGRFPIAATSPGIVDAFRALVVGRSTETELAGIVLESSGIAELTKFNFIFTQCILRCFVQYRIYVGDSPIATLALTVPHRRFLFPALDPAASYQVSRFAYCHREEEEMVAETPLFGAKLLLHDWRSSALLSALSKRRTLAGLAAAMPFLSAEAIEGVLQLMTAGRLIAPENSCDEAASLPLQQWEFHDLLFHTRSRIGRHNHRIGATFRHLGKIAPLPLVEKQHVEEQQHETFALPVPASAGSGNAMTVFDAIEARRSIRQHGTQALTAEQLGEFLYRVARIRALWDFEVKGTDGALQETVQLSNRPYPAGGALYELEIYLTIDRCEGLEAGLYRYLPLTHRLVKVSVANEKTAALLRDACMASGITQKPQVLISLAARFQRMSWKYASISYAATLKNVGVLYQTMYLVATGMGLAACGLGSGNSDLFAEAAGTSYYAETSVGEFMLGSLPESEELPPWMHDKNVRLNESLPTL
jgi:oxazoline/thiazoline dehydrogenase